MAALGSCAPTPLADRPRPSEGRDAGALLAEARTGSPRCSRIVQKTPRYPPAESHAQSTRKLLVRPSTMREARMTMAATVMPLLGIPPSLVGSSCAWPSDRVATRPAGREPRPEGEPGTPYPQPPWVGHAILAHGHRLKKRRDPHHGRAHRRPVARRDAAVAPPAPGRVLGPLFLAEPAPQDPRHHRRSASQLRRHERLPCPSSGGCLVKRHTVPGPAG
jgi:hypothetical protein